MVTKEILQGHKSLDIANNSNLTTTRILKSTKSIDKITRKDNIRAAVNSPEFKSYSAVDAWFKSDFIEFLALQFTEASIDSWQEFFVEAGWSMKDEDKFFRCLYKLEPIKIPFKIPSSAFNQIIQFTPLLNMMKADLEAWREVNSQKAKRLVCSINLYQ